MKTKNFEKTLPDGYRQVMHINAKDAKIGIILNLVALLVAAIAMLAFLIPVFMGKMALPLLPEHLMLVCSAYVILTVIFMVLHELVHGAAYKRLTGEKLTYGLSWSCAFCGVPNIYTYRKTAIISLIAPLVTISLFLLPLTIVLYFVHPLAYLTSALVFVTHLGGCGGDAWIFFLFLTKFKNPATLMRDTGPEQFFYVPEQDEKT